MKKTLLLLTSFFLAVHIINAQIDATIVPNPVNTTADGGSDIPGDAHIKNNTNQIQTYTWIKREISTTSGWETAVCDNNTCYPPTTLTETFMLGAEMEGDLIVHAYPNGNAGEAQVEVLVYIEGQTDTIVGTYNFCVSIDASECSVISTSTKEIESSSIEITPNPAKDFSQVKLTVPTPQDVSVQVYSVVGRELSTQTYGSLFGSQQLLLDTRNLSKGLYLVRVNVGSQIITKKLMIAK